MRWKIIIVNAGIVFIVGLLNYSILATVLGDALGDASSRRLDVERATRAAVAQLALDGIRVEQWLSTSVVNQEAAQGVFSTGTTQGRREAATTQAGRVMEAAARAPLFAQMRPTLVLFVDEQGVVLGRDHVALMRGDDIGSVYPSLQRALASGTSGSAIWLNQKRQEQLLASYSVVRDDAGSVVGAVVVGIPANDGRLLRISELTSGVPLVLAAEKATGGIEVIASSGSIPQVILDDARGNSSGLPEVLQRGEFAILGGPATHVLGAAPVTGYPGATRAVLMAAASNSVVSDLRVTLWPVWAITALGILMVVVAGGMLGLYMSRPIAQLEEGLLTVINGQTQTRFELEHPELGGLVFRINSLLNALTGVPEDDDTSSE